MIATLRRFCALLALGMLVMSFGLALGGAATFTESGGGQSAAKATSQATFGGSIYRNMVNMVDKNVPTTWSVEPGKFKNVKWVAELGNVAHGGPVVYGGRVFVGTNNGTPRDPKLKGPKAILMCFAEKDGAFLWQNVHDMPEEDVIRDGLTHGLCSTPTVEGDAVYYCTPGCEVVCALAKDGKIVWKYDMMKELKVFPCYLCSCSPLLVGDTLYVVTGNGTNEQGKVAAPAAPSFVALNKATGKLLWQSNLPGGKIIQGQWSNAVYAEVGGKPQVIFPGGDGWLYGLEPKTGKAIWQFKCSPKQTKDDRGIAHYIVATPVVHDNRLYVAVGAYPGYESAPRIGHFFCIDITKSGDVSCKNENFDPKDPANKDSALLWHFGGLVSPPPAKARRVYMGSSASTAAVCDGLVYIAEDPGYLHCLDAKSGKQYWEHDFKDAILGSPYAVDGKVYLLADGGECHIFEQGKKYQKPRDNDMNETRLESTPVVVSGVLYIATPSKVYAIGAK